VRPFLGSHAGGVRYMGIDRDGIAQLELEGSCDGCPSSTLTVQNAIETAIRQAAPEIAGIEVAGVPAQNGLLQVRMGPPPDWHAPGTVCPATRAEAS
jgi:Fe-S cluster biogenesis protein NfuA